MNVELERHRYYFEVFLNNPLFNGVSPDSIQELLRLTQSRICTNRTCVLDASDTSHHFFFVISGKLKVYVFDTKNDRQLTLTLLIPKDVFSVMSLFGGLKRKVYYETLERTELLYVPLPEMKKWLMQNHDFSLSLMKYMAYKIQTLEKSVTNIVMEDIPTRLAKLLYQNMDKETGVIEHINDLSHDEIGALIGTTRSVVNRHINCFKDQGILEVGRKYMRITSIEGLKREFQHSRV
ncbi:MAG: Crp/Fnr family transcriptional regulator [Muriicola sp.]|nr:Crp/Fnr family transcriptional regulator [Muriicola sp.]MBT8282398.1 Crp/Fnr family transcriptional regulator [Muriicola sp.]NNK12567.1 Crp/Fnr family transcriptional regulator [Flavobacteriaceae bacterium]